TNLLNGIDIGRGSATNRAYSYAGAQDTGQSERQPTFAGNDWHESMDGDGFLMAVDKSNPLRAYAMDNGTFPRTPDGRLTWQGFTAAATVGVNGTLADCSGTACLGVRETDATGVNVYANDVAEFNPSGRTLFLSTNTGDTFSAMNTFPSPITGLN